MAKKKANTNDEDRAVLDYLRKVNRPYSATDVFNNLHGKYQKPSIVKALERLSDQELVSSKTYGKMLIYAIKQNKDDMPSSAEIEEMSKEIAQLTARYEELKEKNRQLGQSLTSARAALTTEDARASLGKTLANIESYRERLETLKSGTQLVCEEDRNKVNASFELYRKEWRARRKLFREMFKTVTEHMPGDISQFKEELGIEDDPIPYEQDPLLDHQE